MKEQDWTNVLGWPGYRVYRKEIEELGKKLKLSVRRKKAGLKSYAPGRLLTKITKTGVNLEHNFEYGTNGAGELTKAIYPYGGWIRWVHRSFTYTGSRMLREVNSRYFGKAPGAAEDTFQFSFDDAGDAGRSFHYWSNLAMGAAARRWTFELTGTYAGRTKQLDMGANATITTTPFSRSVYDT